MSLLIRIVAVSVLAIGSARAEIACPAQVEGHRLARMDGGSLYTGDPSRNMLLAPDRENVGGRGVNIWETPDPTTMTLSCGYEGRAGRLTMQLTPEISHCTQDVNARTFSCK